MNLVLVKIFATGVALSQAMAHPGDVKSAFDPIQDQAQVAQLLSDGCAHMREVFQLEDINIDELIATALKDPEAVAQGITTVRGLNIPDLYAAYRQFCKHEKVDNSPIDLGEIITYYNQALANLPGTDALQNIKLPATSILLDGQGNRFAEVYKDDQRRINIPLSDIPNYVQQAFVSAEDKRFYQHHGVDERGIIRAFMGMMGKEGRPQGGSTITQQVVKNLVVGDDVTYERKIKEIVLASRLETVLNKQQILNLYLNSIYLGRGAWGIEMASRAYFGKSAKDLTLVEGALLAALPKGPGYYNPTIHPDRAKERLGYVLGRMKADGALQADQQASTGLPKLVAFERPRPDGGFEFIDEVAREAKKVASVDNLTASTYLVRTTINPDLQRQVESSLQEGLSRYEMRAGRREFHGPEANLTEAIKRIDAKGAKAADKVPEKDASDDDADKPDIKNFAANLPSWQVALQSMNLPLYDVHWTPAIVLNLPDPKKGGSIGVGLRDGRVMALTDAPPTIARKLALNDVVYVTVIEAKGKAASHADLRVRPSVQGATIVLENKTGRILAMAGSFSYPLSQLNRVTQAARQPGSSLKPITYLTALQSGLQPDTLVNDTPLTLPPIGSNFQSNIQVEEKDYWSPRNFDNTIWGTITLRHAIENSRNLATAHLLEGITPNPEESLDKICALAKEAGVYSECERYYPFILGAQPVRMVDLAAFYAAIANEGARPTPHVIESISQGDQVVFDKEDTSLTRIGSADAASFYQLKTLVQGVVARGTAGSRAELSPYVGGKTGTSEDENDAWFVGFTNDVTIAVWVGYDNGDGKRRTLGGGQTGSEVALPIFDPIVRATWQMVAPQAKLVGPSKEAAKKLVAIQVDPRTGDRLPPGTKGGIAEYFRTDAAGRPLDTRYALLGPNDVMGPDQVGPDGYYNGAYNNNPISGFFGALFGRPQNQYGTPQAQPRYGWSQSQPGFQLQNPPQYAPQGQQYSQYPQRPYGPPAARAVQPQYQPQARQYAQPPQQYYYGRPQSLYDRPYQ